jgi:hypothetical protein
MPRSATWREGLRLNLEDFGVILRVYLIEETKSTLYTLEDRCIAKSTKTHSSARYIIQTVSNLYFNQLICIFLKYIPSILRSSSLPQANS